MDPPSGMHGSISGAVRSPDFSHVDVDLRHTHIHTRGDPGENNDKYKTIMMG